ncbi:PepSY domain-containing protein [Serratia ureilytica]
MGSGAARCARRWNRRRQGRAAPAERRGQSRTVTEVDRSWPTQVDAVAIAPQSFAVVDQVRFDTFPLIAKLTRWGIDAHMGILFGLPNQLLLAAFGLGCADDRAGLPHVVDPPPGGGSAASGAYAGCRLAGAFPAGARRHAAGGSRTGLLPAGDGREPRGVAAGGRVALARPTARPPGRNAKRPPAAPRCVSSALRWRRWRWRSAA